jgi:hypothetical protein
LKRTSTDFSDHFLNRILSSYWLAHFYLLENPPKGCTILVWITDVGILKIFYYRDLILKTTVDFPEFLEHGSAEKIAVCGHRNRDPNKQELGFIFV